MMIKTFYILIISLISSSLIYTQQNEPEDELSRFSARIDKDKIYLMWNVINPKDARMVKVEYRKAGQNNYELLKRIKITQLSANDTVGVVNYNYETKVKENGVYFFRIILLDVNNTELDTDEIKLGVSGVSDARLFQNNPNPFNPSTTITYEISTPGNVSLKVFTLTGREISTLVDEFKTPGKYSVQFDSSNFNELSSGIYLYKLQTDFSSDIRKMIFTK